PVTVVTMVTAGPALARASGAHLTSPPPWSGRDLPGSPYAGQMRAALPLQRDHDHRADSTASGKTTRTSQARLRRTWPAGVRATVPWHDAASGRLGNRSAGAGDPGVPAPRGGTARG